ncbi:MAG TPA: hypothetical protein VGT61_00640 [Thermomicrobiales bacterium]|jgi:hypothetical protein|nr:hypothetical protein [Thermomicrobiales bacterium]
MATRPDIPLETLHGQWSDAITAALGDDLVPTDDTAPGYEHTWATRLPAGDEGAHRLLVVCPWHWAAYSHYQFWELAAIPWLARQAGYRDWCLVTNHAWTAWIPPALEGIFGRVIAADDQPIDAIRAWLTECPERQTVRLPRDRPPGRVLLGDPTPRQTTVTLKAALGQHLGRRAITGRKVTTRQVDATLRPNVVIKDAGPEPVLIYAKSFRNPDVIHEAKMLMGRALLSPDDSRPVVVIDGRWRDAPELIARSGADVCTLDRLVELLG